MKSELILRVLVVASLLGVILVALPLPQTSIVPFEFTITISDTRNVTSFQLGTFTVFYTGSKTILAISCQIYYQMFNPSRPILVYNGVGPCPQTSAWLPVLAITSANTRTLVYPDPAQITTTAFTNTTRIVTGQETLQKTLVQQTSRTASSNVSLILQQPSLLLVALIAIAVAAASITLIVANRRNASSKTKNQNNVLKAEPRVF